MASNVGAELSGPGSFAAGINPVLQGAISAQNQHKLMQEYLKQMGGGGQGQNSDHLAVMLDSVKKMLSGELVPGSSMKKSDKGDLSINLPAFSGGQQDAQTNAVAGSQLPGGSGTNWNDPSQQAKLSPMLRAFNPFL